VKRGNSTRKQGTLPAEAFSDDFAYADLGSQSSSRSSSARDDSSGPVLETREESVSKSNKKDPRWRYE